VAETVTEIRPPQRRPDRVVISTDYTPAFTPRELDMIKDATGRAYTAIVQDDDSDDRMVVTAWLKLRRDGHEIGLDEMRDVVIELSAAAPDPTSGEPSSSSSTSAASGP
jgi:hypothetical protein